MKRTLPKKQRAVANGVALDSPGIPVKWTGYYRQLLALRERLTGDQRGLVGETVGGATAGMHIADLASDRSEQGLASILLTSERNALLEIEEALGRMRSGTYGICELSGRRIPATRLRAVPWTRFTAAAEQQLEAKLRPVDAEEVQEKGSVKATPRKGTTRNARAPEDD
jgi:RNA polymerase-binding transcription factor DksA